MSKLSTEQQKNINWALAAYKAKVAGDSITRAAAYVLYGDYYAGRHKLTFATQKFRDTFGDTFQAMKENLCPAVIDGIADKLQLEKLKTEAGDDADLDEVWKRCRLDQLQGEIHKDALTYGDSYVVVWEDSEDFTRPVIYPNLPGSIVVQYHSEKLGYITKGAKYFPHESGKIRLNVYFPDRTEKYITTNKAKSLPVTAAAFEIFIEEDEEWPLFNPYDKVPIFHFANNAGVGQPGVSELRDIIVLNDALNKSLCDMLVAMEFEAFAQRWVSGLEPKKDENGKEIAPFKSGVDRLWIAKKAEATFGEFSRADLASFITVQNSLRAAIARNAGFPLYYFMLETGTPPSGEALKTSTARVTAKVSDRQISFGNRWEDIAKFCLEIKGRRDVATVAKWKDTSPGLTEKETWEVATLQRDNGVSRKQVLSERNYTEPQIAQFIVDNYADEFGDGAPPSPQDTPAPDTKPAPDDVTDDA